jgi:flagellar protein FliS
VIVRPDPREAYRRVDFDAHVAGANPRQLVGLCFDQLTAALTSALHAERRGDNAGKSQALTRAIAALTALQLGVDRAQPIGAALLQLYEAARQSLLASAVRFDPASIERIRIDFSELRQSLLEAR